MLPSVLHNYAFNLSYAGMLTADVDDEAMCRQPGGIINHPAWQLGHLAYASGFAAMMLGGEAALPESWADLFGRGSTPSDDRSKYPAKAELLATLARLHEQVSEALNGADPSLLAQPVPDEEFRALMPTVGDGLTYLLVSHEATHLGQVCAWRRVMGLPSVF